MSPFPFFLIEKSIRNMRLALSNFHNQIYTTDVCTEVGEHIAQVFTGLMIRQPGEDKFTVDKVTGKE
jgi:hypothetical protein